MNGGAGNTCDARHLSLRMPPVRPGSRDKPLATRNATVSVMIGRRLRVYPQTHAPHPGRAITISGGTVQWPFVLARLSLYRFPPRTGFPCPTLPRPACNARPRPSARPSNSNRCSCPTARPACCCIRAAPPARANPCRSWWMPASTSPSSSTTPTSIRCGNTKSARKRTSASRRSTASSSLMPTMTRTTGSRGSRGWNTNPSAASAARSVSTCASSAPPSMRTSMAFGCSPARWASRAGRT